jgi:hypothetical protein
VADIVDISGNPFGESQVKADDVQGSGPASDDGMSFTERARYEEALEEEDRYVNTLEEKNNSKYGKFNHPLTENNFDSPLTWNKAVEKLSDKWWRLNNLYYIIDKNGNRVPFKAFLEQEWLFKHRWFRNVILKDRQRGFTTFIDLFILDEVLFNPNQEALIIAHNLVDAAKIFRRKIKYPYDHLPDVIKRARPLLTRSKTELELGPSGEHDSVLSVSTSGRSGTYNYVHISEFGKICARYSDKAEEIVTGTFPSIHNEALLFIESTAEGKFGYFYEYCAAAQKLNEKIKRGEAKLSHNDFKFFFYAWWSDRTKRDETPIVIGSKQQQYFEEVEAKCGITLSDPQKYWYIRAKALLQDKMKQENPSTVDEAFEQVVKGSYFGANLTWLHKNRRITTVPVESGIPVDTWWDLGMNDVTAIWFTQTVGREIRVIDYYENHSEGFSFYAKVLFDEKKYSYGSHSAPHDISVRELGAEGRSRMESAALVGIRFDRVDRIENKQDAINAARRIFPLCWFDEVRCDVGLSRLQGYRREFDEKTQQFKNKPKHDVNSNGADAFMTFAVGHHVAQHIAVTQQTPSAVGWT